MEREVQILNKLGLHARPAAEFVKAVREFRSTIILRKGEQEFSAASILEVLTACLDFGSRVTIIADGPDAAAAIEKLCALLEEFRRWEEES